jgi:hypothetical protein
MKKLVIRNLKDFFEIDFDNQFQVLGELEKKLNESNNVLTTIDVKVNDNVFAIFDLIKIEYSKKTIFTYHYSTSAS